MSELKGHCYCSPGLSELLSWFCLEHLKSQHRRGIEMSYKDLIGSVSYCAYYLGFAGLLAGISKILKIPKELFRKSYHIFCSLSIFILIHLFDHWYVAALASVVPFVLGHIVILLSKKFPRFAFPRMKRNTPKKDELSWQTMYVSTSFVLLVSFCWGLLGPAWRYHAAVGIMGWGFGDALSAIVGKRFGKRKVNGPVFDPHKTIEGTSAGSLAAFAAIFGTTMSFGAYPWQVNMMISFVLAICTGVLELVCRKGLDNLVLPISIGLLSVFMNLVFLFILA